jgi:L-threonylcarbamoyladenylate synthase
MERLRIDIANPDMLTVERAAQALDHGDVIAAPSDTVYGFLARPDRPRAVEELARLKSRAGPFLVLVAAWEDARRLSAELGEERWARLARVWPGPVTVILPASEDAAGAHRGTIALRMPNATFLVALIRAAGTPLLSTSANRAGEATPVRAQEVARAFTEEISLLLDGGPADSEIPSTLVDWTQSSPRVLRVGRGDPALLLDPHEGGA